MRVASIRAGLALVAALFFAVALWAQDTNGPNYEAWETVASRAERAVETARASDEAFDNLRAEIVDWRGRFQEQLNANASRIATLREQIAALGPVPEEGGSEPTEIAARRAELNAQLERLSTPRRTAEEAFSRAGGIVGEIDEILRQRQADQLLNMGPWPVNPGLWPEAWRDVQETVAATAAGMSQAWRNPATRAQAQDNLPLVIGLVILGVALLARSRRWSEALATRIQRADTHTGSGVAGFVVSLGQIVLPMLGLFALLRALGATDLFGPRAEVLLSAMEPMGFTIFFALWLASRIFPRDEALPTPLTLPPERRTEGRIYAFILGVVVALSYLTNQFSEFERYSLATRAVLHFPLIVVASLLTLRIGWLMRRNLREAESDGQTERAFGARVIRLLGQGAIIVGALAPVLAALGYGVASKALIYPAIQTLALFGVLALLQQLVRDIYSALRPGHSVAESLIPTLVGFALILAAAIPLSLIWGARITDLTDLWDRLRNGLTIGDITISPGSFFMLIVVFALGYALTRGAQAALRTSVLPKTKLDTGGQTAVVAGVGYVGIFLAALVAITSAGIDLSNIAIVAGALSVGIGFGLQTIVSNFVSGIILLIERPISEGDWIEVGGQMGYVRNISVRSTRIETFDRTDVIVPNADLISGTVTNYTRGNTVGRVIISVGVAYGTDTRRVEGILREIAEAHPMALANPAPMILFAGFGADSLDFELRIILRDVNWSLSVRNDINHQIAERFAAEGIEIPFAQRDVWLRNPETLQQAGATAAQSPEPQPEIDPSVGDDDANDADTDGDGR
ncbi:DUF3772 domain-containing protein [uncultured Tateyamaria sp.]|uniref:DUF3772 domain-containing protein n=1 Tax=Tateyamaria sp. 1078 TaxID=3417464 RepID=UPI00262826A9|nr:DUF3772 domain-containing protein [uncultured Tateyamaria sp.]